MSATEVLRRMLDERGVEWMDVSPFPSMKPWKTSYVSFTGEEITLSCYDEPKWIMGTMVFHTPEQAIAATLGSCNCSNSERTDGTCQVDTTENWLPAERYHRCKRCGAFFAVLDASSDIPPHFCPNCGRRVEVD